MTLTSVPHIGDSNSRFMQLVGAPCLLNTQTGAMRTSILRQLLHKRPLNLCNLLICTTYMIRLYTISEHIPLVPALLCPVNQHQTFHRIIIDEEPQCAEWSTFPSDSISDIGLDNKQLFSTGSAPLCNPFWPSLTAIQLIFSLAKEGKRICVLWAQSVRNQLCQSSFFSLNVKWNKALSC